MIQNSIAPPKQYFGKYRGVVVDNLDPEKRGRIQVMIPSVSKEGRRSWALPCVPMAADKVGIYTIPPKNAQVWIDFEEGDPDRPVWSGCFWSILAAPGTLPETKIIKFGSAEIAITDLTGDNSLELTVGAEGVGSKLKLTAEGITLSYGDTEITLGPAGIEIRSGTSSIRVGEAEIELASANANISVIGAANTVSVNKGALEVI